MSSPTPSTTISIQLSKLRETSWKEYGVRFLFGGSITVVTGILGKTFGPVVAGLFLAFPAILPASVTLVEKHDGRDEAAVDSAGAAIGSVGLIAFGAVVWVLAPRLSAWAVLTIATCVWFAVAAAGWWVIMRGRDQQFG